MALASRTFLFQLCGRDLSCPQGPTYGLELSTRLSTGCRLVHGAVAHNEVHPGRGGDVVGKIGGVATVLRPFILSTPSGRPLLQLLPLPCRSGVGPAWALAQHPAHDLDASCDREAGSEREQEALPCRVLESPASEVPEEGGIKRPDRYC